MKKALKQFIKKTPIYKARIAVKQKEALKEWERSGRPAPPPHIVKQRAIKQFAEKYGLKILIETGTYYGDMVEAMKNSFKQVYSIELSHELFEKATQRFAGNDKVKIIHGDSGVKLGELIPSLDEAALFWLDGHYSAGITAKGDNDTPIYEELTHIFGSPTKGHVILIDDARLFGTDPSYPSMDELSRFIRSRNPNVEIDVENDSIRIVPTGNIS